MQNPVSILPVAASMSNIWKGIRQIAPLLEDGLCLLPRNGRNVKIREAPWLVGGLRCLPEWRTDVGDSSNVQVVSEVNALESGSGGSQD